MKSKETQRQKKEARLQGLTVLSSIRSTSDKRHDSRTCRTVRHTQTKRLYVLDLLKWRIISGRLPITRYPANIPVCYTRVIEPI